MRDLLLQLSHLAGRRSLALSSFDLTSLIRADDFQIAPTVAEYFSNCVPSVGLDLNVCRILSASDIDFENRECVPSCFCAPHGFITIATETCGDAFSVDVVGGKVFRISHEKYESDGIHPGWNANHTAFLQPIAVTRQNIIGTAEGSWESFADFFNSCLGHTNADV